MSNSSVMCVYCGKHIAYDGHKERQDVYAEMIKHDAACEKNPLVKKIQELEAENERLKTGISNAYPITDQEMGRV